MDHENPIEPVAFAEPALSPEEAAAATLGVIRHMTSTYAVGDYRYSSLVDAIAQARRAGPAMPAAPAAADASS